MNERRERELNDIYITNGLRNSIYKLSKSSPKLRHLRNWKRKTVHF